MLSFFPRGVLDEILNLIGSVAEGFLSYSFRILGRPRFRILGGGGGQCLEYWRGQGLEYLGEGGKLPVGS